MPLHIGTIHLSFHTRPGFICGVLTFRIRKKVPGQPAGLFCALEPAHPAVALQWVSSKPQSKRLTFVSGESPGVKHVRGEGRQVVVVQTYLPDRLQIAECTALYSVDLIGSEIQVSQIGKLLKCVLGDFFDLGRTQV